MPRYKLLSPQTVAGVPRPAGFEVEIDGPLQREHPSVGPAEAYEIAEQLFGEIDPNGQGWRLTVGPGAPLGGNEGELAPAIKALMEEGWRSDRVSLISPDSFRKLVAALDMVFQQARAEEKAHSTIPALLKEISAAWEERRAAAAELRTAIDMAEVRGEARITELLKVMT